MDQNSAGFMCLKNTFPRIRDVKIKEGVFVGSQIRELIQDVKFEDQQSEVEKAAWKSFKNVTTSFWEIIRQKTIVIWWLMLYNATKLWGCKMSLKVHFLDCHLDFFPAQKMLLG
jgi:hypothetical protein